MEKGILEIKMLSRGNFYCIMVNAIIFCSHESGRKETYADSFAEFLKYVA